jgi:hypothetical protein
MRGSKNEQYLEEPAKTWKQFDRNKCIEYPTRNGKLKNKNDEKRHIVVLGVHNVGFYVSSLLNSNTVV